MTDRGDEDKGAEVRRGITKQLTCPACGVVVAEATYRRWPPSLVLTSLDGTRIQPEGVAVQLRREEARRAAAVTPVAQREAEERIGFLRRNAPELVFDLSCREGHARLCTMPALVRAMRRAGGSWVTLP